MLLSSKTIYLHPILSSKSKSLQFFSNRFSSNIILFHLQCLSIGESTGKNLSASFLSLLNCFFFPATLRHCNQLCVCVFPAPLFFFYLGMMWVTFHPYVPETCDHIISVLFLFLRTDKHIGVMWIFVLAVMACFTIVDKFKCLYTHKLSWFSPLPETPNLTVVWLELQ